MEAEIQPTQKYVGYFIPTDYKDGNGKIRHEILFIESSYENRGKQYKEPTRIADIAVMLSWQGLTGVSSYAV
ncbi:hypothetical protein [Clostridium tyrobutyricum]|uniref:hypothetical protein n=1 Tax=Clostridium tyrobutyricum TaxID=1519 RepID=UPI0030CB7780